MENDASDMAYNLILVVGPDVIRTLTQFAGAALIAWLAVRWALNRYKSEKLWDRQIEAAAEVLKALQELGRLNRIEMSQVNGVKYGEDAEQEFIERWRIAMGNLRSALAVAMIVWPEDDAAKIATILDSIERANAGPGDWPSAVADQQEAIVLGHKVIRSIAKDLRRH